MLYAVNVTTLYNVAVWGIPALTLVEVSLYIIYQRKVCVTEIKIYYGIFPIKNFTLDAHLACNPDR